MTGVLIVIIVLGVFVVFLVLKGLVIVRQAETIVIERLGRYHRVLKSGLNVIVPVIDRPREVQWRYISQLPDGKSYIQIKKISRIDLREMVYDFPRQNVITKDNVLTEINALLYFQITEPMRVAYEIANLPNAIEKLTQTTLRNVIGELDLDETLSSRDKINSKLRLILDEATDKWGVKVNRVELQDINPPKDIRAAMEKQMRAERDRRAVILQAEGQKKSQVLESEGNKESKINRADGERQSNILIAEGEAQARLKVAQADAQVIKMITDAVRESGGNPTSYLIAMRYIDTLKEMVSGKDNKVIYLPIEATGVLGSLGGIRDMFEQGKNITTT